ncbi:ATP-binding protein [Desulfolutivibrio sulfoxidireducens]|uniref:ATP-binding protein n=1 Tax=Desulfolutivibrio sulfoxidireducens TaxID=2773299 RepID=UPI00159D78CA|nr:ATP-binding protein [Desulfolutivibrio sulfoxidireducens]QLA20116.1 hypothetical protein GD604_10490 [Desulfolutivibrio sulfoxidireducens]
MDHDTCYENFLKIMFEFKMIEFNEADTRAKIIDRILKQCLNWKESNISRENHVTDGYIDYKISQGSVTKFVIEAKKTGDHFAIPLIRKNRYYKIDGSIKSIPNLIEAMEQAKRYCDDIGCKYAIITNGYQFILFTAIILGKSWREGKCLVFRSLEDIKDNFLLFYRIFASDSVAEGSLVSHMEKHRSLLKFGKIIDTIHNPDYTWSRNELYTYIQPIAEIAFHELLDDRRSNILKECYVYEKTNTTKDELDSFFCDYLPHFSKQYNVKEIDKTGASSELIGLMRRDRLNKGQLIVLLGGIGVGKSTFIHRYYKFILSDVEQFLWFYIDFRNIEPTPLAIEEFIFRQIDEKWKAVYHEVLYEKIRTELSDHDKNDFKYYYGKLFKALHSIGYNISIVIDNIDQHDIELQESIFLYASNICDTLKTITLISVRENTFLMSTRLGVFDAYHIPKFHISAPDFIILIIKRIDYAIKLVKSNDFDKLFYPMPVEKKSQLVAYLTVIKTSLLSKNPQAEKIVKFIDNISVGNMREALRMFNNFIVSGNTNVNEILCKYRSTGSYQIAFHQFIKSMLLGERRYYDQDKSNIINLFDFDTSISDSHSNLFRILHFLYDKYNTQSKIGTGYVEIDCILNVGNEIGLAREVLRDSLERLAKYSLVELDNLSKIDIKNASYAKITHAGVFYLKELCKQFVYIDTVLSDTPIADCATFDKILLMINETDIPKRLARAEEFCRYLKNMEDEEFKNYPELTTNDFSNKPFLTTIYNEYIVQQPSIHENYLRRRDSNSSF